MIDGDFYKLKPEYQHIWNGIFKDTIFRLETRAIVNVCHISSTRGDSTVTLRPSSKTDRGFYSIAPRIMRDKLGRHGYWSHKQHYKFQQIPNPYNIK